jgi:membrane associated rhomboid family serine protease
MLNLLTRPVSLIVAVIVTLISFTSFATQTPDTICEHGIDKSVMRNFYHVNLSHLGINLTTFNIFSRAEDTIGSGPYIILLLLLLLSTSVLDYLVTLVFPDLKCSIGFSGILFGIMAWEIMILHEFNPFALILLVINVISPTLRDPRASLIGHGIGALSGIIVALIYRG